MQIDHGSEPVNCCTYDRCIAQLRVSPLEYSELLGSPVLDDHLASDDPLRLVVVEGGGDIPAPGSLPFVLVATEPAPNADVVTDRPDLIPKSLAAVTLVTLLRASDEVAVDVALALESAAYSLLQGSADFDAHEPLTDVGPTVLIDRDRDELRVTLNRPDRHNAITAQLRDELCAALELARVDDSIERVVLDGAGPSFCSGGDLAEFGARADPAAAHLIRLTRSPARLIHRLADRVEVRIHGQTLGGGIEMAAFAGRVVAAPDTRIALPEVALGLIPGAGGTVSLPRRIGRQRTAWLALTGDTIDAPTALDWGLIDAIA